ncbi:hypothetical protein GJAV_G00046070 [Gymnothorax javanicus]|nr:hypothetical protein GJAV_G00046070 [Gymnothorax javanicus]
MLDPNHQELVENILLIALMAMACSRGWCPPCRDFTPILCDFYTDLVEENDPPAQLEIVFISSDKSLEDMIEYYHDMHGDWLALPWHDQFKHDLKKKYNITAVPKLVIVKENGEVITDKGRKQIRDQGLACFRSWLEVAEIFQNFKGACLGRIA